MSCTPEDVRFKLKEAITLVEEAEAASARARGKSEAALRALKLALELHDNFTKGAEV